MNQGCPGEGADRRAMGFIVCPLQRLLSWHTEKPPRLHQHALWAWGVWPPYLVINRPAELVLDPDRGMWEVMRWRLFRVGWRFDRNWRGYIGPSAACKRVTEPLLYF